MYKWNAKDYHKSSAQQQKWAQELILKLTLKGNERVLDIGCGDGKVTAAITRQLPEGYVVGIDYSNEMIGFARKNYPTKRYPNLTFKLKDASNLDFNNEFDVVFSNAVLHWVIDHLPILKGIQMSLKPSGKVLLQMGGKGNAAKILNELEIMLSSNKWKQYFNDFTFPYGFYGPEEYKDWLEQAGFDVRRIELIPKDMVHNQKEGFSAWIRTTWLPYIQRVPKRRKDEFINEIVDRYIEKYPPDTEGLIHIQMMRLEVECMNS